MRFAFTDEQEEFRRILRRFLEDKSPPSAVRQAMASETGWDAALWSALGRDLGLPGIAIPEDYGGQGFGAVELALALEEMGRALACAPFFSSAVLAATAILEAGTDAQKRALLPAIASGACRAALAFTEDNGRWDADGVGLTATPSGNGWRLDGAKSYVLDGHTAALLVVLARAPGSSGTDGLSFFTLAGDAAGLDRRPLVTLDPTRRQARQWFDAEAAELLGEAGAAAAPFARTLDLAVVGLAGEMVGGAERLRQSTVDYLMLRVQFGRAVGSFQALKHRSADMLLEVELAKSAVYYAAGAAAEGDAELPALASLAKAAASEAYMQAGIYAIQMHGGIGFTWDHDAHLWFKRAKSSEVLLGDPAYHRELMLRRWGV